MRSRNLKPGFFKNELLGSADPLYSILFEGLWCSADREGRLEDRPLRLCAEIFPYRRKVTERKLDRMLEWLAENGFILRYRVEKVNGSKATGSDQKRYIQILEFLKHQHPHSKEAPSIIPAPTSLPHGAYTGEDPDDSGPSTGAARLIPSSLIPDSGFLIPSSPESRGENAELDAGKVEPENPERPDDYPPIQRIRVSYPKVAGRVDWLSGVKAASVLIGDQRATWAQLEAGVTRYAAHCEATGKTGTQYVLQPKNFFGEPDEPWKQDWAIPPSRAEVREQKRVAQEWEQLRGRRESIGIADFRDPIADETPDQYRQAQDAEYERRKKDRSKATPLKERLASLAASKAAPT